MRVVFVVLAQVIAAVLVTGAVLPAIVATVPAARGELGGRLILFGTIGAIFCLLRLIWPRPKH